MASYLALKARAQAIADLQSRIPNNQYGLPAGFYRADLVDSDEDNGGGAHALALHNHGIPEHALSEAGGGSEPHLSPSSNSEPSLFDDLPERVAQDGSSRNGSGSAVTMSQSQAFVRLGYDEGFPTLPDGMPFWTQLECEPLSAYHLLQAYLEQGSQGARQLFALPHDIREMIARGATQLVSDNTPSLEELYVLYHLYHWEARARAFDLFEQVAIQRTMERRALETLDHHYLQASRLFNAGMIYLESVPDEEMNPKIALEMVKLGHQIQRVSLGLPVNGPPTNRDAPVLPANAPVEYLMRKLAEMGGMAGDISDGEYFADIVKDVDVLEVAQQLVVRMTSRPTGDDVKTLNEIDRLESGHHVYVPEKAM